MWRSPARWRPAQFSWLMPAEFAPFAAWLLPGVAGLLAMLVSKMMTGQFPAQPERLAQLSLFGEYWHTMLLYSPLWGFPAVVAAIVLRGVLLSAGYFGWASAILAGLAAGLAVPLLMGRNFWIAGPSYGAAFLLVQHLIYRMRSA